MKKKTEYTDAPHDVADAIMSGSRVTDFLPPPAELVRKHPKVKVTITLNKRSIDFFKREAKAHKTKYQTMINEVLNRYAETYDQSPKQ